MKEENTLLKQFGKYVSLNILAMIGSSCYILADTFFVANGVGEDGLTALNLSIAIFSLLQAIGLMLGMGSGTRYGICKGQKDMESGSSTFSSAVKIGIIIGIVFVLIGQFLSEDIARLIGAQGKIVPMASVYMKTFLGFAPFFVINNILLVFVRNDGNPKIATIGVIAGNLANIVLDYVFIYPFGWSMFGAAFATGIAPIVSILCISSHFIMKKNGFRFIKSKISKFQIKDFVFLGAPSFVGEMATSISLLVFNLILMNIGGNLAVAAYGIVANIAIVGVALFTGVAQGIQPMVSHNFGQSNMDNLKLIRKYAVIVSLVIATTAFLIILLWNTQVVGAFNKDDNPLLQAMAEKGLLIYFSAFFIGGINIILAGYLSAMEKASYGLIIATMRGLLILVPAVIILSKLFGVTGVWLSMPVTEIITVCATLWCLGRKECQE